MAIFKKTCYRLFLLSWEFAVKLFRFLLVLCIPAIFLNVSLNACGPFDFENELKSSPSSVWDLLSYDNLSFSSIMSFVEMVESGEILEEDGGWGLDEAMRFMAFLARNGVPDWDTQGKEELERDIEWLFSDEDEGLDDEGSWWWFSSFDGEKCSIIPAVSYQSYQQPKVILCKSWLSKKWKKTKKFVKKHKKAVIVATVVVVAVVIVVATKGAGTPVAAGMVGAAGASDVSEGRPRVNKPGDVKFEDESNADIAQTIPESSRPIPPSPQTSEPFVANRDGNSNSEAMEEVAQEQISVIKETLYAQVPSEVLNVDPKEEPTLWETFKENFQEQSSAAAHGFHQAMSGSREGHEWIDSVFGTDQADNYPAVEHEDSQPKIVMGTLPPPGLPASGTNLISAAGRTAAVARSTGVAVGGAAVGSALTRGLPNTPQFQRENQIRNDLVGKGYNVPPRPEGVPENWNVESSRKGGGVKYTLETTKKNGELYYKEEVRVMPANPNSPNECQRKPYVKHRIEDKFYDKDGNVVDKGSPEAHIDYAEYDFKKISDKTQKE
ncbi:hypothetical protein [Candidatus Neptunochlamydia vexilliferae]|uniref:hypothetical protein n=1 Tax=Candidatus Neptunichlamydia vexilliferae TaxID=1651774 RepID=UPI0018912BB1|nr:hypothetical protein [Candidatus Neptunochlamydia vexilliferae]